MNGEKSPKDSTPKNSIMQDKQSNGMSNNSPRPSAKHSDFTPPRKESSKISNLNQCFDPNLAEYVGTNAFPMQLFEPKYYGKRKDFLQSIGCGIGQNGTALSSANVSLNGTD
jgi:hypothetical protein